MKCAACGHVPQESSPKFCSECGDRMVPQESSMEIQGGNSQALNVDEPSSLEDGLAALSLKKRKKKKKNKKKKGTRTGSDSVNSLESSPSSLDNYSNSEEQSDGNVFKEKLMASGDPENNENISPSLVLQNDIPSTQIIPQQGQLIPSGDPKANPNINPSQAYQNDIPARNAIPSQDTVTPSENNANIENISPSPFIPNDRHTSHDHEETNLPTTCPENETCPTNSEANARTVGLSAEEEHSPILIEKEGKSAACEEKDNDDNSSEKDKVNISEKEKRNKKSKNKNIKVNDGPKGSSTNKDDHANSSESIGSKGTLHEESQNKKEINNVENHQSDKKKFTNNGEETSGPQKQNKDSKNKDEKDTKGQANENACAQSDVDIAPKKGQNPKKSQINKNKEHPNDPLKNVQEPQNIDKQNNGAQNENSSRKSVDSLQKNSNIDSDKSPKKEPMKSKNKPENGLKTPPTNTLPENKEEKHTDNTRPADLTDSITVYFHVVVSKDFELNHDTDEIIVRAGNMKEYNPWQDVVCHMHFTRELKEHGWLYEGQTKIPKTYMDKDIPYKYLAVRNNKPEYEYIYKPEDSAKGGLIINRCLYIQSTGISNQEWHQYDDIMCMNQHKTMFRKVIDLIAKRVTKSDIFKGKQIAAEIMLDSISSILSTCDAINLSSFFSQLQQFYFVSTKSFIFENDRKKEWTSHGFGKVEVNTLIMKLLHKICAPFLNKNSQAEHFIIQNRLAAGLVCLKVIEMLSIKPIKEDLTNICSVLCLEDMPRDDLLGELENTRKIFSEIKGMDMHLKTLCHMCLDEDVRHWIWVLPVLHTFCALTNPDNSPMSGKLKQEDQWAGLEGLPYEKFIRPYQSWKRTDTLYFMVNKKYLLQADRTLVRSWLCLLPVEQMTTFLDQLPVPCLDVLTACYYKFQIISYSQTENVQGILKKLLHIIQSLKDRPPQTELDKLWNISLHLHYIMCSKETLMRRWELPELSVSIVLHLIGVANLQDTSNAPESQQTPADDVLQNAINLTKRWLKTIFKDRFNFYSYSEITFLKELQVWNNLITMGENVPHKWTEYLITDLTLKIKQEDPVTQIEVYCRDQTQLQKLHKSIEKCFEDCAIEAVHFACQSQSNILNSLSQYNLENFGRLVSTVVSNSWPKDDGGNLATGYDDILQHILQWADSTHIFKLYGADKNIISTFPDDVKELVALAESVFLKLRSDLMSGDVLYKHLECVVEKKTHFLAICKLKIEKKENLQIRDIEKVLHWRTKEIESIKNEQKRVDSLLKMCQSVDEIIKVNISELQSKHTEDLDLKKLNEIVSVERLDSAPQNSESHYNLSSSVMNMADHLHNYKESHIFGLCWKNDARDLAESYKKNYDEDDIHEDDDDETNNENLEDFELTLEDLAEELFTPCFNKYKTIYEEFKSGRVTFEIVDSLLEDYKNLYEKLYKEFQLMCKLGKDDRGVWIANRVEQIEQYHQLHIAFNSAHAIENVKNCFNLSGDFKTLQTLLQFADNFDEYKQQPLSCINLDIMKTKQVLSEITEKRTECLEEIVKGKDFINWVKEALDDVNELKVFVDLASISAGENDMDVDRVACFHDAVLGYSSLLYELKPDFGFDNLMQLLPKLWKALESDGKLPKKLKDSARHIEWLKTVKESHGSVELSSLSLATTINKKGIYLIQAPTESKKITPDSVVRLYLDEELQEEVRFYTLEELKELLNKLMLMSGKGDQHNTEVEKFSEIFANVQRLVNSYIDLYLAGNMLFRTWKATIYCSDDTEFGVKMDFKLKVIGEIEAQGSLTELLPNICKTMENLLEQWTEFMDKERSQLYYLNYYTAEQLIFLCQQFQRMDISEEALVMLSFIKPECTKYDTAKAMFSSQKVRSADMSKRLVNPAKTTLHFKMQSCTDMLEKLKIIWEYSMDYMGSLFPGCLDISTLGKCLACLAALEEGKMVNRNLHPSLLQGRPNLILCPRSEILPSAIAIYMHSSEQALPSYDEVLLCTPHTTYEEVALFLRRCLTSGYIGKKIYSLIFADELSYDIASKFVQVFQHLQAQSGPNYNLVIICNCDREHCYIPSEFSQYKVHMIPQKPLLEIQQYFEQHFSVSNISSMVAPVFKNSMSVGIVSSKRAGVGKSLYVKRLHEKLRCKMPKEKPVLKTIRLIKPEVDENKVLQMLVPFLSGEYKKKAIIFHIDITSSVNSGISEFLFKLLVLQYLLDSEGRLWKRQPSHLYIIEILESSSAISKKQSRSVPLMKQSNFIDFFPKISCFTPKEVLARVTETPAATDCGDPGMDDEEFRSECFQRPFQYLIRFEQKQNLDTFLYKKGSVEGHPARCLQLFLLYCGIIDPSWAELRNFAWFLNLQLRDCESSIFCDHELVGDTLQGFKNFVVNFMILMAKDFATPSLHIADQSPGREVFNFSGVKEEDLAPFLMRKKWESEPHPYIFFNDDHVSMTFIGFHLCLNDTGGVDAINPKNNRIIQKNIMSAQLYAGLQLQRVPFNIDFDQLPRDEKIGSLCMVLGIQWPFDPDESYELTLDNMLKILAIKMRFRCGIPVIIMGETGCGKTRLIKFICKLCKGFVDAENMKLVKVHGGTSADTIYSNILEAQQLAVLNKENQFDTVLFFDEANTTEAISSIKEALCDHTVEGEPLIANSGLHIIAACNPYRKHTDEMIKRLESAGLGYRVKADETRERLGSIPLRQLVYRVHALPPSMMPLVWDFGQLNNETERKYILQIVQRLAKEFNISRNDIQLLTNVLSVSQSYMRRRNDECSFVSLRDVERCVEVFKWFHNHNMQLSENLKAMLEKKKKNYIKKDIVVWSLVLAAGVCYHASLETKDAYRKAICECFPEPYKGNQLAILQEITNIQDLFLSGVHLRPTIARNNALKENLFMMVICIELKIPLFLVGKPGSSKSLAKTIVADAMQGQAAHTNLYKDLKQIHLVSFQCSPHSTPEGIISTFKHCARFQEGKNLNEYVSVVVLDEIGLAEDSPKMPLKTLHPLLEDGCIEDDPLPHKKVGFIGISNWALDPAKMNRGIFVSRGDPDKKELINSAKGICSSTNFILGKVDPFFSDFATAYKEVCKAQKKQKKEFFGLRDFYSLIKMVFASTKNSETEPTTYEIARAVLRNFSGKDDVNALNIFMVNKEGKKISEEINTIDLVLENIKSDSDDGECRYLLILTKNYAALQILQQVFCKENQQPEIIFGSSFPKDQEYTQICRNINRIKNCMETGQMVILLNLQNLYESLYDALNQYYVYLAGQKYVDLGLGTHRVKCRVHQNFRLIVIEEKEVVYKDFPIPLINRLEKHYMDINSVLSREQKVVVRELEDWINKFTKADTEQLLVGQQTYSPSDVFIGYHSDTCASVVLQVTEMIKEKYHINESMGEIKSEAKRVLLNCATPDSVIRHCRTELVDEYFKKQNHSSLMDFVGCHIRSGFEKRSIFTEITTFSRLLTSADKMILEAEVQKEVTCIEVLSLQQFDTEHSFLKKIRNFLEGFSGNKLLIIQTDFEDGSQGAHLVASAKYSTVNEINKVNLEKVSVFVYFITKLPRMQGGTSYVGFQGGLWQSVHIDDLRKSRDIVSDITALQNLTISQLFYEAVNVPEMEKNTQMASEPNPNRTNASSQSTEMEVEMDEVDPDNVDPNAMEIDENAVTETDMDTTGNEIEMSKWKTNVENVLDTTMLIRSCLQNAIGMLRDEECSRSTRRIEILINLLSNEDNLKACFLKMLKVRLHAMLKNQEENSFDAKAWVVREASNPDALQEAGTFRHTLWKRIQSAVTPYLAYLLSVVDRDANFEILVNPDLNDYVKSLWMFIFNDEKLLNISYLQNKSSPHIETIPVRNYMKLSVCEGNCVPFSWRIKDYLDEIWAQAQCIDNVEGPEMKFVSIFSQTPLGQYLTTMDIRDHQNIFVGYARDFILLAMSISCSKELQLMEFALLSCIDELCNSKGEKELTLPLVHLAYHHFRHRLQNFARIVSISPSVLDTLNQNLTELQSAIGGQMTIDIYATIACLETLKSTVLEPSPQAWLHQVKNLQIPIDLICSENYLQGDSPWCQQTIKQIKVEWNCVLSMALFVEHMLMDESVQNSQMQEFLRQHTIFLGNSLEGFTDLKSIRPFLAVIGILQKCRDEAGKLVSRFGVQVCPICHEDPKEPVCLPCDHAFCHSCLNQWLATEKHNCPLCKTELPENFTIRVSKELRLVVQKNAQFRKQCNGFFIDIICSLCFKDNTPPDDDVILHLLSLVFINKECLLSQSGGSKKYTKSLSPFDDSVDKTPVIRSVILKLLLKYSFDDIKKHVKRYFDTLQESHILSKEDTTEVYMLFVNCLEDSMYEKINSLQESEKNKYLGEQGSFLKQYLQNHKQHGPKEASIHFLQAIAKIRLAMDSAAELLSTQCHVRNNCDYMKHVKDFCVHSANDWYRIYLIRKLANLSGIETVQKLFKDDHFRWLFPPQIIQKKGDQTSQIDLFLVCGNNYKLLRDGIGKALLECKEESILKAQKECKGPDCEQAAYLLLAVFREITMLHGTPNSLNQDAVAKQDSVKNFIQNSAVLMEDGTRQFVQSLLNNSRSILKVEPGMTGVHCSIVGLAMHAAAVLLNGKNKLLEPLKNLAFFPAKMQNSYLPTMPEDMLSYAKNLFPGVRWYVCPNNHYSAVGECGQPMEISRCIDCGAQVGGMNHIAHQGYKIIQEEVDRTQTGHILGAPERQGSNLAPDRDVTAPTFILLRLVTHLSMILGAEVNIQYLRNILKPQVEDVGSFLARHIAKDLEHLKNTLGKSADETTTVVHMILCNLLKDPQQIGQWHVNFDDTLSTKAGRNNWEKYMANAYITPVIQTLDKDLLEVNNYISKDERISCNPIVKIVYGDPLINDFIRLLRDSHVHCSKIWSCRKRVSIEYLLHVAQQKDGKDIVPILWKFLEKQDELRMVKFLPEILNLQKDLVKMSQNHREMDNQTVKEFLSSVHSDGARRIFQKRIEAFMFTWNHLRNSLCVNGEIKLPEGTCDVNITLDSDFAMFLPRRAGLGLCATALVSYLINLHNNFVHIVEKYTEDEQGYIISASEVMDLHVISYELEKDLMPIILSNCQYSVEKGSEALEELDLEKIERQITSRFLQGKPFINLVGLPTLIYSHDRNYDNLFVDLKKKLSQESLKNSTIDIISRDLNSYSDVCEALHITEVTLGFLAMSGGDAELLLTSYVENVLQMGEQTNGHILEALKRCHLKHTIALWQLLTALKSEHLLRLKKDPFKEVDKAYKKELNQNGEALLISFFEQNGLNLFLLELHEMIMLKLKKQRSANDFPPSWLLRETLGPLLYEKDIDFQELDSDFPEQIALAHCIETWKIAAKMKWKRH